MIFTILLIFTYGVGFNMLASYNLQSTFSGYSFYNPETTPWVIGLILAVICGYCLIGGGKRIINITTFLVPFMGCAYILVALIIVAINFKLLPDVFKAIFSEAFDFQAILVVFRLLCDVWHKKRSFQQ